ncbi:MAG: hypothetical protein IJ651_00985 [Bacteroidales bacterium]|nr:hypothetical protein [Bacteroidales bacterium]
MKKYFTILVLAAVGTTAAAQNWADAYLFSENVYGGTARTVGMGNAVTAIGGDPGTLVFNPAGSAVAAYSQLSITPGVTFSVASATGTVLSGDTRPIGFGDQYRTGFMKAKLPNVSFITSFDTGKRRGVKRYSFGFSFNATNNFTSRFNAAGVNSDNSYAASLASSADGFSASVMGEEDWFYSGDPARMPAWVDMVGYRSGMIGSVDGMDGAYIALTETMDENGNFRLAAPVYQKYGRQSSGYKSDFILNFAADISDVFYVGANLGLVNLNYNQVQYWQESPEIESEFPTIAYSDGTTATFSSLLMQQNYRATGSGLYVKAGVLWRPTSSLRVAAAVQTPTILRITERYGYKGQATLKGKASPSASSPEDEWSYQLRMPWRLNAGIAYSIGNVAVLSADYEMVNFGSNRFATYSSGDGSFVENSFSTVNDEISQMLGLSHMLRLGAEVKPIPSLAVRAGYNLDTNPQTGLSSLLKHAFSLGLGWSSAGSFYMDAAVRLRTVPAEYIIPYYYYYAPSAGSFYDKYVRDDVLTPEIEVKTLFADALLTLGWRF